MQCSILSQKTSPKPDGLKSEEFPKLKEELIEKNAEYSALAIETTKMGTAAGRIRLWNQVLDS